MTPDLNFSNINLQYLILVRDLAKHDPQLVGTLLGVSDEMGEAFTLITPSMLGQIASIQSPLLVPRHEPWWWARLLKALADGQQNEIEVVLDHSGFITSLVEGDGQ